ncbi:MAG: peptidylprolyl isomerase [Nanoarchaeota archaeon]|nr:peptidylprolyl isomerase [Nanoarchaeota archaeon]
MLQKKDFIEIEYTARVKGGEIFDSNIKEDLEKLHHGHDHEISAEPFVFCLGEGMFLPAIDNFLIGKPDAQATYEIPLSPENAFGKRNPDLIQRIPVKLFREQSLNPVPGFIFNFDGRIGKVLASSGGRVIVDFNNPVSGKEVVYTVKLIRKIDDLNEKIKALIRFLFQRDLKFETRDKAVIIEVEKQMMGFVNLFKDKFKDILDLELEAREMESAKSEENAGKVND